MTDYKSIEKIRTRDERIMNAVSSGLAMVALVLLIWALCYGCVDGIIAEVERQEQYEKRPVYASETYRQPAAYRLSSPTPDQMDSYHHMMQVMEVAAVRGEVVR